VRSERTNIITIEDPVEYQIPGVNQTQIKANPGEIPLCLIALVRDNGARSNALFSRARCKLNGAEVFNFDFVELQRINAADYGIRDGDYVVVSKRSDAQNGQTVVALIRGEATLKRYYLEGSRVRLQPANAQMKPLTVSAREVTLQGVVTGLIRHYA
jgi:hypothetical protein